MRVTMQDQIGSRVVYRFGQQIAAEEGVNLQPLAFQCRLDGRVMEERDAKVGVHACEGPLQPVGQHLRVRDERLHLGLAEIAAMGTSRTRTPASSRTRRTSSSRSAW